jgi:hypothetical protein
MVFIGCPLRRYADLEMEGKRDLMEHVAHQCICMQYLLGKLIVYVDGTRTHRSS